MSRSLESTFKVTIAPKKINLIVADLIRELCTEKRITSDSLARQIGISIKVMERMDNGLVDFRIDTLSSICDVLEMPLDLFLQHVHVRYKIKSSYNFILSAVKD